MKQYKTGYTQGVFDMFHIGHLNLLKAASEQCEELIVGVNSDELVEAYKHKRPVIGQRERAEIVSNIKCVSNCFISETLDKVAILKEHPFDAMFIGDDWKGNPRWEQTKLDLAEYGVDVVFLPYTKGVSSTMLRPESDKKVEG